MGLVFLGHAGLEGVVPRSVPIHMRVVGWAQNNEWVYVRGVCEGPGKGGTVSVHGMHNFGHIEHAK